MLYIGHVHDLKKLLVDLAHKIVAPFIGRGSRHRTILSIVARTRSGPFPMITPGVQDFISKVVLKP